MIAVAQAAHPELALRRRCALLGSNRAWYSAQRREGLAGLAEAMRLRDAIERFVLASPGDSRSQVTRALQRDGWSINHKRVLRVMRQQSLLCRLQ